MLASVDEILDRAIKTRLIATLSGQGEATPWQARLLSTDKDSGGLWIHPIDETAKHSLDGVIARGAPVEVAVADNHERLSARSSIVRRNRHFWLTQELMYNAVLLRGPIEFQPAERRAHPRFRVPDGTSTFAQITSADAIFALRVRPWDVSNGGISFLCPRDPSILKLKADSKLNFVLSYRGRTVAGTGNVRFTRLLTERVVKIGVKIHSDSIDAVSGENLHYLIDDVARIERARH